MYVDKLIIRNTSTCVIEDYISHIDIHPALYLMNVEHKTSSI